MKWNNHFTFLNVFFLQSYIRLRHEIGQFRPLGYSVSLTLTLPTRTLPNSDTQIQFSPDSDHPNSDPWETLSSGQFKPPDNTDPPKSDPSQIRPLDHSDPWTVQNSGQFRPTRFRPLPIRTSFRLPIQTLLIQTLPIQTHIGSELFKMYVDDTLNNTAVHIIDTKIQSARLINRFVPGLYFFSNFVIKHKIGIYRLPTYRLGVHRKFLLL